MRGLAVRRERRHALESELAKHRPIVKRLSRKMQDKPGQVTFSRELLVYLRKK